MIQRVSVAVCLVGSVFAIPSSLTVGWDTVEAYTFGGKTDLAYAPTTEFDAAEDGCEVVLPAALADGFTPNTDYDLEVTSTMTLAHWVSASAGMFKDKKSYAASSDPLKAMSTVFVWTAPEEAGPVSFRSLCGQMKVSPVVLYVSKIVTLEAGKDDADCLVCTQQTPTCDAACAKEDCVVTAQACKSCATATCKATDPGTAADAGGMVKLTDLGAAGGYAGTVKITGTVSLTFFAGGKVNMAYDLAGVEEECASGPSEAANSCGIHIHSGSGCDTKAAQGGHYYTADSDPWATVAYSAAKGAQDVVFGHTFAESVGKAFVVHDRSGARVTCTLLEADTTASAGDTGDAGDTDEESGSPGLRAAGAGLAAATVLTLAVAM